MWRYYQWPQRPEAPEKVTATAMEESSERPKGKSLRPLRALAPYIRPYLGTLCLALAALVLASGAQLVIPVAIRYLIDAGLLADSAASIDRYFLALFVVAIAFALFSAFRFYLVTWLGETMPTSSWSTAKPELRRERSSPSAST